MIEAIDRVVVNDIVSISPLVEYFIHPDNYFFPVVYHSTPKSGVMAGLYASVALGPLLGTSRKPF